MPLGWATAPGISESSSVKWEGTGRKVNTFPSSSSSELRGPLSLILGKTGQHREEDNAVGSWPREVMDLVWVLTT